MFKLHVYIFFYKSAFRLPKIHINGTYITVISGSENFKHRSQQKNNNSGTAGKYQTQLGDHKPSWFYLFGLSKSQCFTHQTVKMK